MLYSCSATKGLQEEDKLYNDIKIDIKDKNNLKDRRLWTNTVSSEVPEPNTPGLFNLRTGLYNIYDSTGTAGFKHTIKYKLGSAPKVFTPNTLLNVENRLKKMVNDFGYFDAEIRCDSTLHRKRKVNIECDITLNKRYTIDSIVFPYDTLGISDMLDEYYTWDHLKSGDYYHQSNIVAERLGLTQEAKNRGYKFFDREKVVFYLDTLHQNHTTDIYIEILPPSDTIAQYTRYIVGDIYVKTGYDVDMDALKSEETFYDDEMKLNIVGKDNLIRPKAYNKFILLEKGKYLDDKNQNLSVNRLLDMGVFKFVNNRMEQRGDTLDQYFILTPQNIKNITGELELNNRSGNLFGMAGSLAFTHKNLFKGAERFKIGLSGGIENQFGVKYLINSSEISLDASLEIPRLVIPFIDAKTTRYFVPKTLISGQLQYQKRINYYAIQNQKLRYGFRWKEDRNKTHELFPIDFTNFYLSSTSERFDSILAEPSNNRLRESFQDLVILGLNYSFTYNNTPDRGSRNSFYFRGGFESSGNTFNLLSSSNRIFKRRVSQYVKITSDIRKYWSHGDNDIATRLYTGAGIAYGSAEELPYSKQFSIGGANSLRAFNLRGLGPGEYIRDTIDGQQFIDQTGDIKLEMNAEYRFPLVGFFKGATFLDAGNIWLIRDGLTDNQQFNVSDFYKQIAIGTGFGLRMDFDFFVFRLDLAFPLRGPDDSGRFDWVIKDFDPLTRTWRRNNLRLNLGLGYPF